MLDISTRTVLRYLAENGVPHRRTDNDGRKTQLQNR
jgi:hypothetical protein